MANILYKGSGGGGATIADVGSVIFPYPFNTTQRLIVTPYALLFDEVLGVVCTTGTLTLSFLINGVGITGLTSISVNQTPQDISSTALNTMAVGDVLTFTIASASSDSSFLSFTTSFIDP
jgi:hypothetical protein